jgi:hypothetical protein
MASRWDQQLRRVRGRRHVGDRPVASVGRHTLERLADAGGGQGGADGGKHRGQLLKVVGLLGQLGGDYHLFEGGGRLGVIALQGAPLAAHEAAVGVGGVGGRPGVGCLIATPRPDVGPGSLAAGPGGGGQLLDALLVALLAGGCLGFQQSLGMLQPGQPLGPAGQHPRQRISSSGVVLLVLGPISLRGLRKQLGAPNASSAIQPSQLRQQSPGARRLRPRHQLPEVLANWGDGNR